MPLPLRRWLARVVRVFRGEHVVEVAVVARTEEQAKDKAEDAAMAVPKTEIVESIIDDSAEVESMKEVGGDGEP